MKKVLITHDLPKEGLNSLYQSCEIIYLKNRLNKLTLDVHSLRECDAILPTYSFKVTKEVIDLCENLKIIANFGVGYDNIDVEYARKKGILVTNSPDPVIEPTAELAFSLMLACARRICECDRNMRKKDGIKIDVMSNLGVGLNKKTLGIIGMGNIGQALARRAKAFGMDVIYFNRNRLSESVEKRYEAQFMALDKLLQTADFISLHAPANSSTYHLIDEPQFELMKPNAILINTARGSLINEKALIANLKAERIFGAGLDVFENEPFVPSELLTLENVILSPHNGTGTIDARIEMTQYAAQNILNFFEGKEVLSPVNR